MEDKPFFLYINGALGCKIHTKDTKEENDSFKPDGFLDVWKYAWKILLILPPYGVALKLTSMGSKIQM